MAAVPALRAHHLTKRFGATHAVEDLTFEVPAGEVFGFLGPNGAGKSTTIRMLLGLLRPTAGQAWIFDTPIADVETAHRSLAYVPAEVALWPSFSGQECLDLLAGVGPGTDLAYRAELVERFQLDPGKRARAYSTGNRQKVALVAAFSTRPPLLVLDEPTSGLDPLMERVFRRCIAEATERGQTVFLSSHQLAEVEAVCTRVGILRAGRLVEVAGLEDLRRLRRSEVTVDLARPAPPDRPGRPARCRRRPVGLAAAADPRADRATGAGAACPGRCRGGPPRRPRGDAGGDLPRLLRPGVGVSTRTPLRAASLVSGELEGSRPVPAVTAGLVRQLRRGTAVVAVVCGGLAALVAVEYQRTLSGALGAESLTALAENPAISTLFGPPVALDDPGGFTVWRTGTVLAVLGGVWAALAGTRITRGEEEAGRAELLLAGLLRLTTLVQRTLAVLLVAGAAIGAAVALGMLLAGTAPAGAVLFGASIGGTVMAGGALGVLTGQLVGDRRTASGLAVAVLLGGLLTRMVADGVPGLSWLHWLSPLGIAGRVAPFAEDRAAPLLGLAVLIASPAALAMAVAGSRDVGSGRWRGRDRRNGASRLLRSLPGLAVHRIRRPTLTWSIGVAAYFLLIGLLATSMLAFLRDNPAFARMAASVGMARLTSVQGYAASLFALLAVPVGAYAASRVAAHASDEAASRLTLLYSRPVSRVRWAAWEAVAVAVGTVVVAAAAGAATWAGAAWVGAGLGLGDALMGAVSVVPVALLCLGAALLALGWAPWGVVALGVLPAAGGFLLKVLGDTFRWPSWLRELSPFAHLAAVPAEPVDVAGAVGMSVLAVVLGVAGVARYAARDLRG